ncbi:hypothetical protein NLX83_06035 [Allokutzneria sp. A3M-2-11 16]|uniref:hypothetical protein n=1 Tax=Allokutzneria sp. A3M-2-11 16 TaxID=2962043 RepID=UPI0020B85E98|nr:hypothetical protein [Allokutzneria sp. A3M-2-11 16]MCP3798811.1 hypothetical protein [Allokutzneria sp. A3M-2-11 16]
MKKVLKALAVAAVMSAGLANPASAAEKAPPSAAGYDQNCGWANGPGNYSTHCVEVRAQGKRVESVFGFLQSHNAPAWPVQICDATIAVWGRTADGAHWEKTDRNAGCSIGIHGTKWFLNMDFMPGSFMCGRTSWQGHMPEPTCVRIQP